MKKSPKLLTLLGPTAVGKTALAARLAYELNGEVISADSRQVFRGMDIGTGKDKADYLVYGFAVPSHLIDIAEAGTEYSVYNFLHDFHDASSAIWSAGKTAILCGGTGLYIEAALKGYDLVEVPENELFRAGMECYKDDELVSMLKQKRPLHNTTDILNRSRLVRALEIESYKESLPERVSPPDLSDTRVIGLRYERATIRKRITNRLMARLEKGMIREVETLMQKGIDANRLKYYGLEYKYIAMYLLGELSYDTMVESLNTAIHQFAKRQMTWFRRMERNGINIHWLDGEDGFNQNLKTLLTLV